MSEYKSRPDSKVKWKEEKDDRQRFEKSHPWHFTQPLGVNLEGGCGCPRNAWGFKKGCVCNAKPRATYPHPKAKGRF